MHSTKLLLPRSKPMHVEAKNCSSSSSSSKASKLRKLKTKKSGREEQEEEEEEDFINPVDLTALSSHFPSQTYHRPSSSFSASSSSSLFEIAAEGEEECILLASSSTGHVLAIDSHQTSSSHPNKRLACLMEKNQVLLLNFATSSSSKFPLVCKARLLQDEAEEEEGILRLELKDLFKRKIELSGQKIYQVLPNEEKSKSKKKKSNKSGDDGQEETVEEPQTIDSAPITFFIEPNQLYSSSLLKEFIRGGKELVLRGERRYLSAKKDMSVTVAKSKITFSEKWKLVDALRWFHVKSCDELLSKIEACKRQYTQEQDRREYLQSFPSSSSELDRECLVVEKHLQSFIESHNTMLQKQAAKTQNKKNSINETSIQSSLPYLKYNTDLTLSSLNISADSRFDFAYIKDRITRIPMALHQEMLYEDLTVLDDDEQDEHDALTFLHDQDQDRDGDEMKLDGGEKIATTKQAETQIEEDADFDSIVGH